MTVGETLTEARNQAGLSVDELSERTRIRGTVISSIERDDYDACGGDLYVRGYVRAIAGAVGIDAQPLIREFEAGRAGADVAATAFDLPVIGTDPATTRFDLPAVAPLPPPAGPLAEGPVTGDLVAAGYDLTPSAGPGPAAEPATRRGRRAFVIAAAAVVVVVAGALAISLTSGGGSGHPAAAASAQASARAAAAAAKASAAARASAAAQASAAASAQASVAAQASQAAAAKAAAERVVAVGVASASAFGPDGFADGDDAGNAGYAIARNPAVPWSTQWYATPQFGMLKHGTGLLLDLGRTVTVTSVQANLSQYGGATMQLRAGNRARPQDLRPAATVSNAGGVVRLTLRHPVTARYLLLWFTVLPSDGAGHYQESVSGVAVSGHR